MAKLKIVRTDGSVLEGEITPAVEYSFEQYAKKLIDNPNWAYDLGERLYETVKDTYDLNVVTKTRGSRFRVTSTTS